MLEKILMRLGGAGDAEEARFSSCGDPWPPRAPSTTRGRPSPPRYQPRRGCQRLQQRASRSEGQHSVSEERSDAAEDAEPAVCLCTQGRA